MPWNHPFPLGKSLKTLLKTSALQLGVEIRRASPRQVQMVSFRPLTTSMGNVLLSHSLRPFLLKEGEPIPHNHAGHWRGLQIAKTFVDLNYTVDVIDYMDQSVVPEKDYALFIDFYINLERIAQLINADCVKVLYIQMAHWTFQNSAEYKRLLALLQRRGLCLKPKRQLIPHWAIEHADYAILHGNDFVRNTYSYAYKPFYFVPMATPVLYSWPKDKDWEACRNHFLWFGNHGFVHKGLDLVLEAFAEMPEYHLTVCGPLQREEEFVEAFYKELYQTPNIHTIGWVDNSSLEFIEIANSCVGTIYPACSEGGSGSVITCMHAGLIPIVSYESGVDMHDFGVLLRSCSIDDIKESIQMVASLAARQLEERARKAWEFARGNHTKEKFAEEFRAVVTTITSKQCSKKELDESQRVYARHSPVSSPHSSL
jgi:glycosyltransferase involved in cell wall biosynthesis